MNVEEEGEEEGRRREMEMELKDRARSLVDQLGYLPSPHKLTSSCRARLIKLVHSEIRFLDRISGCPHAAAGLASTNLGYLEAVVQVLQHPLVDAASAVLQTFPVSPLKPIEIGTHQTEAEAHVDIVCAFQARPVWIVVSDRNPRYLFWLDEGSRRKGLRSRVQLLIKAALANSVLQPTAVIFCFAKGISRSLGESLETEFGASRVETFGLDIVQKLSDSKITETPQSSCELVEMFSEVEGGEWVDIKMVKEHVDWLSMRRRGFHGEAGVDRGQEIVSMESAHGVALERWVTFQVDIKAFVDRSQAISHHEFSSSHETRIWAPFSKELVPAKGSNDDVILQKSSQQEENTAASPLMLQGGSGDDHLVDGFQYIYGQANTSFSSLLATLISYMSRLTDKEANTLLTSNLVNLDTTAMVALVSEVSNGGASMLVSMSKEDMISKFGSTAKFMRDQAESELEMPLLPEMTTIMAHKRPFISQSVCDEFKSLVSLCGGLQEKQRADELLNVLLVLPNTPSTRVMGLRETGKVKEKNKTIFGTGDSWHAPTLTSNMSFVRAVRQTGMALSVIEHRPRALVGDKCKQ